MIKNFHQLYIFHSVARLGSFSRAAEDLGISQPAVSIQVRELEKTMDTSLLHRMRRGLQLTETGNVVYSYTQRIFGLAEEMESSIQDIQGLKAGKLAIGSSTTPGEYILPWVIGQFRSAYPEIDVSLSITNTEAIVQRVLDHEFDLGLAGAPVHVKGLAWFEYVDDEIVVIASPESPLAKRPSVSIEEVAAQKFILREPGSATRSAAEEYMTEHSVSLQGVMELGSNEAVKRAVAANLGLGIISKFGVTPDTLAGYIKVLNVEGWNCRRPLTVFHRDDTNLPPAQAEFLKFLKNKNHLPDQSIDA